MYQALENLISNQKKQLLNVEMDLGLSAKVEEERVLDMGELVVGYK